MSTWKNLQANRKIAKHVYKTKYNIGCNELCQFRMNISLCKISNRWQIHNTKESKKGIHSVHMGHFQISSEHIHTNIRLMPKNEIKLAKQCSQLNLTNSTTASLVSIRNVLGVGNTWTRHQIYYKSKIDNGMQ